MRVRRETVTEQCVQLLRKEILERRLLPGTAITEDATARDMGISRPTVREVFNTLIVEGLLTRNRTTRAVCVTRLTPDDIREIYRARRLLEAGGVLAYAERPDSALEPLLAATDALVAAIETGDNRIIIQKDIACHIEIVGLVGSADLADFYSKLLSKLLLAMVDVTRTRRYDMLALRNDHIHLVDLLRERRIEEARRTVIDRLDRAEMHLISVAEK